MDDLLAAILAIGMAAQQRRGYERGYLPEEEDLLGVRGRIDMRQTARNEMARRQKAHCVYDEFTEDTEKNRILKATARILAASKKVDPARRRDLKRCLVYMGGITDVGTARIDWKRLGYDRNNSGYLMLMNVCYMVLNGLVLSTDSGDKSAASFMDNQELHALYEKFLREYFKRHHPAGLSISIEFSPISRPILTRLPRWFSRINHDNDDGTGIVVPCLITMTYPSMLWASTT